MRGKADPGLPSPWAPWQLLQAAAPLLPCAAMVAPWLRWASVGWAAAVGAMIGPAGAGAGAEAAATGAEAGATAGVVAAGSLRPQPASVAAAKADSSRLA